MLRSAVPDHNNQRHLSYDEAENNIGSLPITDNRIKPLFDSLDVEHTGNVSIDTMKTFFNHLKHFGIISTEKDVDEKLRRCANTYDDAITYD